jgi:hypothetical protein
MKLGPARKLAIVTIAAWGLYARAAVTRDPGALVPQEDSGNVVLYISNLDRRVDPLQITVSLDGAAIVRTAVPVGNMFPFFYEYHFRWPAGEHEIRVESTEVNAKGAWHVKIAGRRWLVIDYGMEPKPAEFLFQVLDEPPAML